MPDDTELLMALRSSFSLIEYQRDGTILNVNDIFERLVGWPSHELVGQHRLSLAQDKTAEACFFDTLFTPQPPSATRFREHCLLNKSGEKIWLCSSYAPVTCPAGKIEKIIEFGSDITKSRRQMEDDQNLLRAINRSQAITEFTIDGRIIYANGNFLAAMGYNAGEIIGMKHSQFITPAYAGSQDYKIFWQRLRAGEFFTGEYLRLGKNGREVWLQASYNPVFNGFGQVVKVVKFATILDERMRNVSLLAGGLNALARGNLDAEITETLIPSLDQLRVDFNHAAKGLRDAIVAMDTARRQRDEMETLANQDQLTGLASLRQLRARLEAAQAKGAPMGVTFIDLDGFKQVNDQYGHEAGDAVLVEVGRRLQHAVHASDVVARRSGDEFLILFENVASKQMMIEIAQRIERDISRPIHFRGLQLHVGASFGHAMQHANGETADSMIERADFAMYDDKRRRKLPIGQA